MTGYDTVERAATVKAAPTAILPLLIDFKRWPEWSPWERLDPELRRIYSGPDSQVGASYEWSGNRKAGAGKMTISSVSDRAVIIDISFTRPFTSASRCIFTLTGTDAGTHLVWRMRTRRNRLSPLVAVLFNADKRIGPDLELGLAGLAKAAAG